MKNMVRMLLLLLALALPEYGFSQEYDDYIKIAYDKIAQNDSVAARKAYSVYMELTGKRDYELEELLSAKPAQILFQPAPVVVENGFAEHVNGAVFVMKEVKGGTFPMGVAKKPEEATELNEYPQHKVQLDDFYILDCEVTQGQWKAIMGTTVSRQAQKYGYKAERGVGDDYPMYYVSWNEAMDFCTRLSELTGKTFRLPTEAEWECAARGGVETEECRYSGGNLIYNVAWMSGNAGSRTHKVKGKSPNALGLYDMSGNVWEWCCDWFGGYSKKAAVSPEGPETGTQRVLRGGSYHDDATECRVTNRGCHSPKKVSSNIGFRIVYIP